MGSVLFLYSTTVLMQLSYQWGAVSSTGTDVGSDILQTTGNRMLDIMFLKWDEWSYNYFQ